MKVVMIMIWACHNLSVKEKFLTTGQVLLNKLIIIPPQQISKGVNWNQLVHPAVRLQLSAQ
jgi:hypothetical protein